jgi:aminopeptidase YwaD
MSMKTAAVLVFVLALVVAGCAPKLQEMTSTDIASGDILQYVKYLASDELKGRKTGEEGNRTAAMWIASHFKRDGLLPAGDEGGYLQHFTFVSSTKAGSRNSLVFTIGDATLPMTMDEQYKPLPSSSDTVLTAPVVFAGYGVSSHDSVKYDDYANVDVKNKIVMVMRYSPAKLSGNAFDERASLMIKAMTARDHGAVGIIYVAAPAGTDGSELSSFKAPASSQSGIATVVMRWSDAQTVMQKCGKDLVALKTGIDSTLVPASTETGASAALSTEIIKIHTPSANICGFLPGNDPALKGQILVLGAHMDHLGMGGEGSLAPDTVAIHHGADDNASGTAGLLELAEYFGTHRENLRRSILFLSFSGEELGLLGSDWYVKHPTMPLDSTIAMINMDMIGRLKDSTLVVEGMGTSPKFDSLVKSENRDSLALKLKPDGYGPSDQASFYSKNLPVMFFFTNLHADYHKPSDTWDKINYPGEAAVVRLVSRLTVDLASAGERPAFTRAAAPPQMGGGDRPGARVTLGVIPDFAEDVAGMKISGARPGTPAEKAGLKGGDIIIGFGGKDVKNIYEFTSLLGQYKPGDHVKIVVKRGTETVTLEAVLEARH